jgi:hypothetical protein
VVLDSPCTFHEGGTHTVRGHFARLTTRSDPEATGTGHLHGATTTTAATTDVDVGATRAIEGTARTNVRSSSSTPSHRSLCVGRSSPSPSSGLITGFTSQILARTRWLSSPSLREPYSLKPSLSHLILHGKPNASHVCARINLHTHDRQ